MNAPIPSVTVAQTTSAHTDKKRRTPSHTHTQKATSVERPLLCPHTMCLSAHDARVLRCLVPRCVWDGRAISAGTHTGENIHPSTQPASQSSIGSPNKGRQKSDVFCCALDRQPQADDTHIHIMRAMDALLCLLPLSPSKSDELQPDRSS